ncbi:hypothetical protein [Desertibaculum subflavum]|uniref:hypothetical protein n=1 Tax=Desertibaculum subflavum TaxID=2268458 RepID=UPI000E6619B2
MRIYLTAPLLTLLLSPLCFEPATAAEPRTSTESISGRAARAIEAALPAARRGGLDVSAHRVTVWETDAEIVVLFNDPNDPPGQRGGGFSVELRKSDLRVLRAHPNR